MSFINNSTGTMGVQRDEVIAMLVQDLKIVLRLKTRPDIVYEEAADPAELDTLKARTWNQLTAE